MITREQRPKTYAQVLHQDLPKSVLRSISKNPSNKPQSILLCGSLGTGKTTLAKIFVRSLNCQSDSGEVCGKCAMCSKDLEAEGLYREYDSSIIGNVNSIRRLRDEFGFSAVKGFRVIVFDECQVCSKEAQAALLKITEEPPSRTFFVFCTTDPDMLLDPLRSRCLELELTTAPPETALRRVEFLCKEYGLTMPNETKAYIVSRSEGHFRNIDMLVNLFMIVGQEEFSKSSKSSKPLFISAFGAMLSKDTAALTDIIAKLHQHPLPHLKSDFEETILIMSKQQVAERGNAHPTVKELGVKVFAISKYYTTIGQNSFGSDSMFESFMWSLMALLWSK